VKPGRWWRAQNSCVDSAKLIKLNDRAHRNWFNLNCVANEHGGILPDLGTVAIKLRISEARAAAAIAELVAFKLFDKREDGSFVPHDWEQWQYRSDLADSTNAERQKKLRAKRRDELNELRALRDNVRNAPLRNDTRNAVTTVTAKRPEADTDITTTGYEERGLGKGNVTKGLGEIIKQKGWA